MGAPSTSQLLNGNSRFVVPSTVKGSPLKLVKLIWNAPPAKGIVPLSLKFTGWDEAVVNVRSPPKLVPPLLLATTAEMVKRVCGESRNAAALAAG